MKHERISVDPKVLGGKPCIKGTRISVEHVLRELSAGASVDDLLKAHPHIARDDVLAALAYAADSLSLEDIVLA
jgi:uncharacterized protein (DUF433 family)